MGGSCHRLLRTRSDQTTNLSYLGKTLKLHPLPFYSPFLLSTYLEPQASRDDSGVGADDLHEQALLSTASLGDFEVG